MNPNGNRRGGDAARLARLCLGALALVILAAAAPAEVESLRIADATPVIVRGKAVGCQVGAGIGRGPTKADWNRALVLTIGVLDFDSGWAGSMKVSVQAGDSVTPPADAYWMDGADGNLEDSTGRLVAADPRYVLFGFRLGDHTRHALSEFTRTGVLKIAVRGADGVDEVWTLDLSERPEVLADWRKCLAGYPTLPDGLRG